MNMFKKYRFKDIGKKIKDETIFFSGLFIISIFLPYFRFCILGEGETIITKTVYGYETKVSIWLSLLYILIIIGVVLKNKSIVSILNIIVSILILLTFVSVQISFVFSGASPIHPITSYGFLIGMALIIIMIIKTNKWRHLFYLLD
jgi:hypothetical protein